MRHVVLPTAHSDADLALAGELVAVLNAETLYVAWTHTRGQGAPEVEATVIESDLPARPTAGALILSAFTTLVRKVAACFGGIIPAARQAARPAEQPARSPVRL